MYIKGVKGSYVNVENDQHKWEIILQFYKWSPFLLFQMEDGKTEGDAPKSKNVLKKKVEKSRKNILKWISELESESESRQNWAR